MKKLLMILTLAAISCSAVAQETKKSRKNKKEEKRQRIDALIRQEEEGVIAYKKHFAFGVKLTTDGYGLFLEKAQASSIRKSLLFQLEITERKHQKELKQNSFFSFSNAITYGKLNYFYPIKAGVQQQFLLSNKSNKNGVSITANIGGGFALGLLRPYEIEVNKNGTLAYIRYDSPDSTLFVSAMNTGEANAPRFSNGWKNLKLTPGIYIKPALRFDYGRYNEVISALEVGLNAEFYTKKIPQVLDNKQQQFFYGAYVGIVLGKRK